MRIVGGKYRGRALRAPKSNAIRPTADRIRESLFNVLVHSHGKSLDQTRVLDLFAGTGALGIEALSRGARFCLFVENSVEGRGILRHNIEALDLQGHSKIYRRDATRLGDIAAMQPFDLVFADPPYGRELGEMAATGALAGGWLAPQALLVLEEEKESLPDQVPGFDHLESRSWSGTAFGIFRVINA